MQEEQSSLQATALPQTAVAATGGNKVITSAQPDVIIDVTCKEVKLKLNTHVPTLKFLMTCLRSVTHLSAVQKYCNALCGCRHFVAKLTESQCVIATFAAMLMSGY